MASAGASGHSTLTPSCNRLIQKKWDDRLLKVHRDRVSGVYLGMKQSGVNQLLYFPIFFQFPVATQYQVLSGQWEAEGICAHQAELKEAKGRSSVSTTDTVSAYLKGASFL